MAEDDHILDPAAIAYAKTDAFSSAGVLAKRSFPLIFSRTGVEAVAASTTAVHTAFATTTTGNTITTGITNPPCARNLVVTFAGTATDLAAVNTTITGTDINDAVISEDFLATLNPGSTVTGSKAFKTVTSIVNGIHDGTGATIAVGFGDKLGLPWKLSMNTNFRTHLGATLEGTAATVAISSSVLASNTIDLNSALDGSAVTAFFLTV